MQQSCRPGCLAKIPSIWSRDFSKGNCCAHGSESSVTLPISCWSMDCIAEFVGFFSELKATLKSWHSFLLLLSFHTDWRSKLAIHVLIWIICKYPIISLSLYCWLVFVWTPTSYVLNTRDQGRIVGLGLSHTSLGSDVWASWIDDAHGYTPVS